MTTFIPFQHQLDAQNILQNMEKTGKGGLLADSMGLGKTVTMSLHLCGNKIERKKDLIVCPISLLKTWEKELKRVSEYLGKEEPAILIYHGDKRVNSLKDGNYDFIITTYAILGSGELNYKRWGRVVLDESHYIKNGLLKKAPKCAKAAFMVGRRSEKNFCISGTPFNNRLKDLISQCVFLGTSPYNDVGWWKTHRDDTEAISKWREQYVLRRTKEGMLVAPIYHNISIVPKKKEEKLVNSLRANAAEDFAKWKRASGLERISLQGKILGLIQKLRIVSNSYYCGEGAVDSEEVLKNNAKVERMIEDMDSQIFKDPRQGLVVFSQFTSFLSVLEQVIEERMVGVEVMKFTGELNSQEREDIVDRFNESNHPRIILVSLMAGGVGLSLHHGSASVFLSEPYYNPFVEQQAEERVHRLGQTSQVEVFRYSMENGVETWIDALKQKKIGIAASLGLARASEDPTDFSFEDLADLFADHVSFTSETGTPIKKTKKEETVVETDKKRQCPNKPKKMKRVPKPKKGVKKE